MGSLLVVTGPPGAGKSTVARLLADRATPSTLVEGDAFFAFLAGGAVEPWLPGAYAQNGTVLGAAAAAAGRFAAGGYETVYDGVLGPWAVARFAAGTGLDRLDYVVLLPSADRCVAGVRARTGHVFTDEAATRKMHGEFARAAVEARHVLLDPPGGPEAVAERVAAARAAGALTMMTP